MSSEVKRYDAFDGYGSAMPGKFIRESDYDALKAENARLVEQLEQARKGSPAMVEYVEEIAQLRAQLAAIQQAKGEEVEVVAHLMLPDFMEPYVSIRRDCSGVLVEPLGKISQFKRITAAMAAEVERKDREAGEALDFLVKQRDALRAKLAEVKGWEAVATVHSGKSASGMPWCEVEWHVQPEPPAGTKLYTTPLASPDVEGLVSIEAARTQAGEIVGLRLTTTANGKTALVFADQAAMPGFRVGDAFVEEPGHPLSYTDISTWRQGWEVKP